MPAKSTRGARRRKARKIKVKLNLYLHKGQRAIRRSKARFKVVACGRQWGKTRLGVPYALSRALEGKQGFWVAPDYKRAQIGWRILKRIARPLEDAGVVTIREADRRIEVLNGGSVEVRSAHVEGQLRAETLDFVVFDEAAFSERERWEQELRPTLAVRRGEALFLSSFNGENFFYDLYTRGLDDDFPDWESWRHPSIDNPWIDDEEIELARRTTPRAEFEQEYEANPLVYQGAVFDGEDVQAAIERGAGATFANLLRANPRALDDLEVHAGLDWGYTNPTVLEICTVDLEGRVSWYVERHWYATKLETRLEDIVELCREHGIEGIYADAAGKDENVSLAAALDDAAERDPSIRAGVVAVKFNQHKVSGIKARRWHLEQGLESIGPECSELARTTKRYRYKEGSEDVIKKDDHPVDAATAFYASRRHVLVGEV